MKNTALISVHSDPNYGSMLQAYALSEVLNKLGCKNEYLNYYPFKKQRVFFVFIKRIIKKVLKFLHIKINKSEYSFWSTKEFSQQKKLFNEFHNKYINSSTKIYYNNTIDLANEVYDKFVVGSDQMWSPKATFSPYSINFLSFVKDSSKKCSYAPSIGTTNISDTYLIKLKESIYDFAYLSCREKTNAEILSSYLGRKVECVLDPTLLLTKDEWLRLSEPINMPDKYILCYILGEKKCIYEYASLLAKNKNIPLYIILTRPEYLHYPNILRDVSVGQFLSLVNYASYVVTDSFHGSLFSINFGTNFYSFSKREQITDINDNDRIGNFLEMVDLLNRLKNDQDVKFENDIDFDKINEILLNYRMKSLEYLKDIIHA